VDAALATTVIEFQLSGRSVVAERVCLSRDFGILAYLGQGFQMFDGRSWFGDYEPRGADDPRRHADCGEPGGK